MERRLAAILAADVVGYSRLMEADEEATLATLNAYRQVIDGLIANHHGRVFGSAGDSVIAEFASPVEAVRCAIAIQTEIEGGDADLPEDRRMRFRIGVNLGDVMAEGDNLFGDGVNIAARLEEVAEQGGVCISAKVHDEVAGKTEGIFIDAGEHRVKNITAPIRVWRWSEAGVAGEPNRSAEALALPDKPSVAVLPFTNMSGDPEQEYFSDGITEDIITELSRFRSLFVIARNSSFTFKGQAVNVMEVGERLGVAYLVEGSVRKAGNRVRVTAQLVEAATGNHLWAERYDRDLEDIFAVQDEVTENITHALLGNVTRAEMNRSRHRRIAQPAAYDLLLRAYDMFLRTAIEDLEPMHSLLDEASRLDPEWGRPVSLKAMTYHHQSFIVGRFEHFAPKAVKTAHRALSLRDPDDHTEAIIAMIKAKSGDLQGAETYMTRALNKNPIDLSTLMAQAHLFVWYGKAEQACEIGERLLRLDPLDPYWTRDLLGYAYYLTGDYGASFQHLSSIDPVSWLPDYAFQAACLGQLGRAEEARAKWRKAVELIPDFSVARFMETIAFRDSGYREHWLEGLQKAGIEE